MNFKSIVTTIRRAVKGEHHDYTQGLILEAVILLAVPMILELGLESVFAITDMFFVSRLGQNAIATVGLTESVITIVYSLGMGISTGASAIIARRIGEKNPQGAAHTGAQAILISVAISILLAVTGVVYAPEILKGMGASREVIETGTSFTRTLLAGNLVIILLFLINGIFRGAGDAAMAMKSLWIASGANIVLNPLFIAVWGLKGAAIATVVGRGIGVAYQIYHLAKGDGVIKMKWSDFHFDFPLSKTILKIAWPASLQFLIGSGSWIILTRLVAETGGMAAAAGTQIAFRNFIFFMLPAWGLSNAAATLVGQNLGAKEFDRAEESVYVTAKLSAVLMAAVTIAFLVFAEPVVRVFSTESDVVAYGITALRVIGAGYVFYGIGMVMSQALNGAGDTKLPTWINFICFWVVQIPLAYALSYSFGVGGVIASIPISHALLALLSWWVFRRGGWRNVKV